MKKQVDKDTVLHTAIILMTANDSTTSLDVKNHLRGLNFWAVQDEISRLMNELSDERSWVRTSNGRFNTYQLTQLTQPVAAVSTTIAPQIAAAILHSDIVDAIGDAIEDAEWVCKQLGIEHHVYNLIPKTQTSSTCSSDPFQSLKAFSSLTRC